MHVQNQLVDGGEILTTPFAHKSLKCAQDAHIIGANSTRKLRQTVLTGQAGTGNCQCLSTTDEPHKRPPQWRQWLPRG